MAAGKPSRINRQYKTKYRIRNWREYERGLRSRGDVTIWLSEDAIAAWIPLKNGLRGGQRRYSNGEGSKNPANTAYVFFLNFISLPDLLVCNHASHGPDQL